MKDRSEFPGMAQCDVTGLWLPRDQIYKYKDWNVCDEGKAMLDLGVGSPAKKANGPGAISRISSWLIDIAIFIPISFAVLETFVDQRSRSDQIIAHFVRDIVFLCYLSFAHAFAGQTIGKKVAGIKVVNLDLSSITTGTAIKRTLYCYGLLLPYYPLTLMGWTTAASIVALVGSILLIFSSIASLGNWIGKQRTLHDLLAGTRVIRLE